MILESLAKGFILGLSLGFTCLGTCLPVLISYLISRKRELKSSFIGTGLFLVGRFAGYIAFGAIAGAIGRTIDNEIRLVATAIGYIILSALLILGAVRKKRDENICPAKKWEKISSHPALYGLLLGISPCPAFFLALTSAFQSGGAIGGILLFAGFFFGTSIFFIPFGFLGVLGRSETIQKIGRLVAVLVGIWFLIMGVLALIPFLGSASEQDFEIVDPDDLGSIYIWGDSASLELFFEKIPSRLSGKFKIRAPDETPDKTFLIVIGELPDTTFLLAREVIILHSENDPHAIGTTARMLATHGFKKPKARGSYLKIAR